MAWPPTADDELRAFEEDGAWYTNHYECPCGHQWEDSWSCQCDDDCPSCGTTCSPSFSEEAEPPEGAEAPDDDTCWKCGAVPGTSAYGTVGDGFDGLCPSCADKEEARRTWQDGEEP